MCDAQNIDLVAAWYIHTSKAVQHDKHVRYLLLDSLYSTNVTIDSIMRLCGTQDDLDGAHPMF
jgi:hypothetical protein